MSAFLAPLLKTDDVVEYEPMPYVDKLPTMTVKEGGPPRGEGTDARVV